VIIQVSPPIVSFKESITSNLSREFDSDVVQEIAERSVTVTVRARPLPQTIVNFIESREEDTRRFIERRQGTPAVEQQESILKYREELKQVFDEAGPEWTQIFSGPTEESGSRIWALGPKRMGPNLLINRIPNFAESQYWRSPVDSSVPVHLQLSEKDGKTEIIGKIESVNADGEHTTQDVDLKEPQLMLRYYFALQQIEASIRSGFQISSRAGPLCDEPMVGVAFEILNVRFHKSEEKKVMYDEFGDVR
jgi:ribosome assembly protein 1